MAEATHKYRVIILGAGFSKAAGLPLADELWRLILARRSSLTGRASMFNDDLEAYVSFRRDCDGTFSTDEVNFEEFLGFLDIEHYLGLRGSDTWSDDGNEGQVVVKTLIGEILAKFIPPRSQIPELYLDFARRLQPHDYVLTFNYDVLLERALETVGKPYRLFPSRFTAILNNSAIVDTSIEEVTILKLHGSIDWFDKSNYLHFVRNHKEHGIDVPPRHPVFNGAEDWGLRSVLEGPRPEGDPLLNMYRVDRIEDLYRQKIMFLATPWILLPSTNKVIYASPLKDFWNGLGVSGGMNFGMAIVGYSMPAHDSYARQAIYSLVKNYQESYWDEGLFGFKKTPLVLVDCKPRGEDLKEYLECYRFVDLEKTELHMSGFDMEALDVIFR